MVLSVLQNVASHMSGQMHFADRNIQLAVARQSESSGVFLIGADLIVSVFFCLQPLNIETFRC